jgi:glycosyltransferase involved in cell wall biosynthesis
MQSENKLPKVTIITPSYNQGEYIEETIRSVVGQTYRNIEYIVIDGDSNDSTHSILNKYSKNINKKVIEPDSGQANAINKGIRAATGDLITWINSDDLLDPHAIEYAVAAFNESPDIEFVYGDIKLIDEHSNQVGFLKGLQVSSPSVFYNLHLPIPQQGSMWRRNVTNSIGLLDERWHYVLDREFFLRICMKHKVKYINQIFGYFRQHGQSKSVKMREAWITELPSMYENLMKYPDWLYSKDKKLSKKIISSSHIHAAYLALSVGEFNIGLKNIGIACRILPSILLNSHIYFKPMNKFRVFIYRKMNK